MKFRELIELIEACKQSGVSLDAKIEVRVFAGEDEAIVPATALSFGPGKKVSIYADGAKAKTVVNAELTGRTFVFLKDTKAPKRKRKP